MEQITYREQIFWGASLNMANEDELDVCYNYIKKELDKHKIYYAKCINAESAKRHWLCGNSIKHYPLCGEASAILKEHLIELIEKMITTDLNIEGEKIIETFKNRGYIEIYPCNRIFFTK